MNDLPYLDAPRRAIAIICRTPDIIWLDFLAGFTSYDIFLIIDNDSYDCAALISAYSSIRFIQVDSEPCTAAGFTELNAVHFNNVTGWDKALYYFSCLNTAYQQIWLFEDDVFFYDENTIKNIDAKYADSDLLTAPFKTSTGTSRHWWWWPMIDIPLEQPYYNAMVCGLRISKKLLNTITAYAQDNKKLFFLEALFPTLAIKNNLLYAHPKELEQIYFRYNWRYLSKKNIFHPVKNIASHPEIRAILSKNNAFYRLKFHFNDKFTRRVTKTKEQIKMMLPEKWQEKKEIYKVEDF